MKKILEFGKVDFFKTGRKINAIEVEVSLTDGVFTVSADVWNNKHTDIVMGGQCLDDLKPFLATNKTFNIIYRLWKLYHLNNMHAGTKKQEEALKQKFGGVDANRYDEQCEYLKSINLYNHNGYIFGSGWLKEEIPTDDLQSIKNLLTM